MKSITLNRSDFKEPTAEVDYFNDYVLEPLGFTKSEGYDPDVYDAIEISVSDSGSYCY